MAARRTPVLLWCAALLAVPTVLAGVSTVWPGPPAPAAAASGAGGSGVVPPGTAIEPITVPATAGPGAPVSDAAAPEAAASAPTAQAPTADALPLAEQVAALVTASPVRFTPDSAVLEGAPADTVRAVAALLAPAGVAVVLEGHVADTPGSPEGAQALSERRAVAVADALVAGGVDRARITTVGRGAAEPLDSRAASRRVEFEIR
ncbi:OmpA family protein [Pseudonocardia saturnea]